MNNYIHRLVWPLKRGFDLLVASVGVLVLSPLLPLIALAIRIDSPGPALFFQQRVGRQWPDRTELFWMIKFRTMRADAEQISGAVWATQQDPRITRLGRFLRKSRLDEIPQLINVIKGDMSLVGPRPERPELYAKLEAQIPFYSERTYGLRPGITGLAQINQGYDSCIEDVRSKVGYDHAYALSLSHPSTWISQDLSVCWRTFWVMVCGRGQ